MRSSTAMDVVSPNWITEHASEHVVGGAIADLAEVKAG